MKNPCKKDCPGRSSTCHAECEAYLAFHEHNKVKNHKNRLQSEVNDFINKEIIKSIKGVR